MKELIAKVLQYSKAERIKRLIELQARGELSPSEEFEVIAIQFIRESNGEIAEVIKNRENIID